MIIDFHAHARRGRGDPRDLIHAMDEVGVDITVIHPIVPTTPGVGESSNEFVAELVARHPGRFLGFACVEPLRDSAPDDLERLVTDLGLKGLKLHPPLQHFSLADSRIHPTLRRAEELQIPVLIHTGPLFVREANLAFGDPMPVDELARIFPDLRIILAHVDPFGLQPYLAGSHPNVYTDTAVVYPRYARLIPGVGEDLLSWMGMAGIPGHTKLLFGTDVNPTNLPRLKDTIAAIRRLEIEDEEKAAILGGNAAKLLKLG